MEIIHENLVLFIVGLISTFGFIFKEVINSYGNKIIEKINKKEIEPKKHPIFQKINNYLKLNTGIIHTENKYKQEVINSRERIYWGLVSKVFNEISLMDLKKCENFNELIKKASDEVDTYTEKMLADGISQKTITVMESSIIHLRVFLNSLINSVLTDKIYDNNNERLWAILSIYNEYLEYGSKTAIKLLVESNGALYGEVYKGIENGKN